MTAATTDPYTFSVIEGGESSCFLTREGSSISLVGDSPRVAGIQRITSCPRGVAFGPLKISTPDRSDPDDDEDYTVAAVENLRFAPTQTRDLGEEEDEDDGGVFPWSDATDDDENTTNETTGAGLLGIAVGATAATDDETAITRRQTIGVFAGALALAGLGTTAAAQTERDRIQFAEFDLVRADAPVHVGILDIVDSALPFDNSVTLAVDGAERAEWTPADALGDETDPNGETLAPSDETRTVKVYLDGGVSDLNALLAWAKGLLSSGAEIKLTTDLPKSPSSMEEGEAAEITRHPAYVETVIEDQGDESVVEIGGESIPHASGSWGKDRGYYEVDDEGSDVDRLVYVAGPDPPDGQLAKLRLRAGTIDSVIDAAGRLT